MDYETKTVSTCCNAGVSESYDGNTEGVTNWCDKCERRCDVTKVCSLCNGEGTIDRLEAVYQNEPHYAPTGTQKCICMLHIDEDY